MATPEQQVEEKPDAAEAAEPSGPVHGGIQVARALHSRGIDKLFTLSGGHLFSIYDGCKTEAIEIIDVRHEQAAAFAADGYAKATRTPGACALTAGPGITNGISAITGARFNNSPVVVLGGRAPEMRWGAGSLQEIDHVPIVESVVKSATTVKDPDQISTATAAAIDLASEPPSGPTFVDFPLDVVFSESETDAPDPPQRTAVVAERTEEAAKLLAAAERPVIMAGTNLYWGRAEDELRALAEALGIPVFLNGMGRGCLPSD
ncbi:MAG: thiamine pyrophosphate-binding protein, partial [Solirubrobacterales bacterium]